MDAVELEQFVKESIMSIKNASKDTGNSDVAFEVEFDLCVSFSDSKVSVISTFGGENPNASKIKFKLPIYV